MASAEVLALLLRLAVAATLAIAIVLVLRRPLRHAFGANAAYAIWALVPVSMLAAAFSRVVAHSEAPTMSVLHMPAAMTAISAEGQAAAFDPASTLVGAWVAGLALWASLRMFAQWRWRRRIGVLRHVGDGTAYAAADGSLPAAVGWPHAIVVLPADFDVRFPEAERSLVLEHERRHVARGDLHAQVLAEALRALLWFHPLVHWAAIRFRHDQELACDAAVMASRPGDSAIYARALAGASGLRLPPVATAWGFSHPLKERIAMLQLPPRSTARRRVGLAMVAFLMILASGLVWASLAREASAPAEGLVRQTWT
ncbi:MAG: M56 family metallopeptidase, partial [Pseudomonadota bacterium]